MSYITRNRKSLAKKHYIRQATAYNYFFDFSSQKLERYKSLFGENFCVVINGSTTVDDTYIIPFVQAKEIFKPDALDHRDRWIGTIKHNTLRLPSVKRTFNVRPFHNAFDNL